MKSISTILNESIHGYKSAAERTSAGTPIDLNVLNVVLGRGKYGSITDEKSGDVATSLATDKFAYSIIYSLEDNSLIILRNTVNDIINGGFDAILDGKTIFRDFVYTKEELIKVIAEFTDIKTDQQGVAEGWELSFNFLKLLGQWEVKHKPKK